MRIAYFFLIIFSFSSFLHPTPRYVKAGNSNPVPPYLSWATASDSIQKCIKVSLPGDTIFVGAGTYKEEVHMTHGLTLIGSGWDSTIVDTRDLNPQNSYGSVQMVDNCSLSGFRIKVSYSDVGAGVNIFCSTTQATVKVTSTLLENCTDGIIIAKGYGIISNNITRSSKYGVSSMSAGIVSGNIVNSPSESGLSSNNGYVTKYFNNIINITKPSSDGIHTAFADANVILNNIIFINNGSATGIDLWSRDTARNNLVHGLCEYGIDSPPAVSIVNNTITGAKAGVDIEERLPIHYQYNNVWNCPRPYWNLSPDSTNISANPMYVNPDSTDFHLQKYSPLIDRGNPALLDPDGTRSDIGAFGGPFGSGYTYKDLPPSIPVNITASVDSGIVKIAWNKNSEADFSHYIIFRDSVSGFASDSTRRIGTTPQPLFTEPLPGGYAKLFYKIIAVDNQGLQSEPGKEVSVIVNGTDNYQFQDNSTYMLYPNYPNPFNGSTTIRFKLQKRGQAALQVYAISGELLATLQNREYEPGYYEEKLDFTTIGRELSSVLYLVSLTAYDSRATVAFRDISKIIYIK